MSRDITGGHMWEGLLLGSSAEVGDGARPPTVNRTAPLPRLPQQLTPTGNDPAQNMISAVVEKRRLNEQSN